MDQYEANKQDFTYAAGWFAASAARADAYASAGRVRSTDEQCGVETLHLYGRGVGTFPARRCNAQKRMSSIIQKGSALVRHRVRGCTTRRIRHAVIVLRTSEISCTSPSSSSWRFVNAVTRNHTMCLVCRTRRVWRTDNRAVQHRKCRQSRVQCVASSPRCSTATWRQFEFCTSQAVPIQPTPLGGSSIRRRRRRRMANLSIHDRLLPRAWPGERLSSADARQRLVTSSSTAI